MGFQHSIQGEVGADIGIEHEERLRASSQDLVPEVVETTPGAQGCKFLQVPVPKDPSLARFQHKVAGVRSQAHPSPPGTQGISPWKNPPSPALASVGSITFGSSGHICAPDWKVKLLLGSFEELGQGLIRLVEANE